MMSLQLLGPVSLHLSGHAVALPTHKSQALLLLVALEGSCHRARLATWLWPMVDESAGRRNLRRELARLREAGAGQVLQSQANVLRLAPEILCDARAFADLADSGQAEAALALWQGPLAEGLQTGATDAFDDWLGVQRRRLVARRHQLLMAQAQAAETAGDVVRAQQCLQLLLSEDPLQEPLHRQAMRLYAVVGERGAALAQYGRCCELLQRELGVPASAETQALADSIRAGHALSDPPRADQRLEPQQDSAGGLEELPMFGRDEVWRALDAAWQANKRIVIEGEAGVGKTRLARDFAASRGAYALAQCRRSDAGVPYASFTRLLRCLAGQSLAQAALPDWVRLELARMLPELGSGAQRIGSAEEQRRFCEACATALDRLCNGSFDTVVLDDWHLADDASLALMSFIWEQRQEAGLAKGLRLIQAQRPNGPEAATAVPLPSLSDGPDALFVCLPPLNGDAVYRLVKRLSGAVDPRRFAHRLERATGGNPFFLGETLRHWLAQGLVVADAQGIWQTPFDDATRDYTELPVPDSVRDTVMARVHRLPVPVRRLLETAALASEPFTPALLAGACALSELETLSAIETAVTAQLLRERDGGFAFVHDLVQTALESDLGPERARLVHRRLALGAEAGGMGAADVARHWEAGGQPERAVGHRMAAAEAAHALYADADAQAHWQAALANGPTLAQRVRILGQRWQSLAHESDLPALREVVRALDAARDQAQQTPGAEPLALEAEVHAAEILAHDQGNVDALNRIQACLASPALNPALRAQALRVQSQALSRLGRTEEARVATQAALAAGGLSLVQQGDLLHALSYTHFLAGAPQQSLDLARRALAVWQSANARRQMAQAQASIGRALDMLDEREAAWSALEDAYAQAAALRMLDLQRIVANNLANNRINHGGPERAISVIREAQALSPHFTMPAMPVFYLGILVQAHAQLGELGAALDLANEALERAQAIGETLTLADCLLMTLGPRCAAGDDAGIQRMLQAMEGRSLAGLDYFGVKVSLALADHARQCGRLDDARTWLDQVGSVESLRIPADQAAARLCRAQLALAEGQAQAALAELEPLANQVLYAEVQAHSCAVRLAALERLGQHDVRALALADEALRGESQGRRLPALGRLALLMARSNAAVMRGEDPTARRTAAEATQLRGKLVASLEGRPALRLRVDALGVGPLHA